VRVRDLIPTIMPELQPMNCSRALASKKDRRRTKSRAWEPGNPTDSHRRPEAHRTTRHGWWADITSSTAVSAAPLSPFVNGDSRQHVAAIVPSKTSCAERSDRGKQCQPHGHGHDNQYCPHELPPQGAVWAAPLECTSERDKAGLFVPRPSTRSGLREPVPVLPFPHSRGQSSDTQGDPFTSRFHQD